MGFRQKNVPTRVDLPLRGSVLIAVEDQETLLFQNGSRTIASVRVDARVIIDQDGKRWEMRDLWQEEERQMLRSCIGFTVREATAFKHGPLEIAFYEPLVIRVEPGPFEGWYMQQPAAGTQHPYPYPEMMTVEWALEGLLVSSNVLD